MRCVSAKTHGSACAVTALAIISTPAFAQGVTNNGQLRLSEQYGLSFSEIGDPGNAFYAYRPYPNSPVEQIGRVNHRYRITTTEVTATQWFRFVEAYAPQLPRNQIPFGSFYGVGVSWQGFDSKGVPIFGFDNSVANLPTVSEWRYVARFANWLHNGAPSRDTAVASDFEQGAYDTSTFGGSSSGGYTDQATRSDGARFWIPSRDEWTKAVYYDPNRHGEGVGGYWQQPGSDDAPLLSGRPEDGGQTNAGRPCSGCPREVMSYLDTRSPWGLWDASGGQSEWLEDYNGAQSRRLVAGSRFQDVTPYEELDLLGRTTVGFPSVGSTGFRIAALVPGPGTAAWVLGFGLLFAQSRRRGFPCCHTEMSRAGRPLLPLPVSAAMRPSA